MVTNSQIFLKRTDLNQKPLLDWSDLNDNNLLKTSVSIVVCDLDMVLIRLDGEIKTVISAFS